MEFMQSKKGKLILISTILMMAVVTVLLFVFTLRDQEGYRVIKITEVHGTVSVVKNGIEYEAYVGMNLQENCVVVTSDNSYVRMVLDDDKYIKVESCSRVIFDKLGRADSGKTTLTLERGSIISEISNPLMIDEEYVINTPNAILAVRGTFFRVYLSVTENGEHNTDVYTYGGKVASKRILPNGKMIEEDVIIEAGYMTTINMDEKNTIYIVYDQNTDKENTYPILFDNINSDDLVDMYFASERGHEMFITTEDILELINTRNIEIEEYIANHDIVEELEKNNAVTAPDDRFQKEQEPTDKITKNLGVPADGGHTHVAMKNLIDATCLMDGYQEIVCSDCKKVLEKEIIKATGHKLIAGGKSDSHTECADCGMIVDTEHSFVDVVIRAATNIEKGEMLHSCECGYSYTSEIDMLEDVPKTENSDVVDREEDGGGDTEDTSDNEDTADTEDMNDDGEDTEHIHTVINGGTADAHSKCATCGEVLSTTHSYTDTVNQAASCVDIGEMLHSCDCGYSYTSVINPTGHTEEHGGTVAVHSKCATCGEVLSTIHSYTDMVNQAASCVDIGEMLHSCDCGYRYTSEINPTGHTEEYGGTVAVHSKCATCGDVLSAVHSYTDTISQAPTCVDVGETTHSCDCGYSYTSEIAATGHTEEDGGTVDVHSKCATCGEVLSTTHDYTDITLLEAGCTTTGMVRHECGCGYYYAETTQALGHSMPTGATSGACTNCGAPMVTLNSTYFPDAAFLSQVSIYDADGDGVLAGEELTTVTSINVSYCGITDMTGVKHFPHVNHLECAYNTGLTTLDISGMDEMAQLNVSGTGLTTLRVDASTNNSRLLMLQAQNCTSLTSIYASGTNLEQLLIAGSDNIAIVDVSGTQFRMMEVLEGYANLTTLNMSNCSNVTEIYLSDCTSLSSLTVDGCTSLETLDVTNCAALTQLDTSTCTSLTNFTTTGSGL